MSASRSGAKPSSVAKPASSNDVEPSSVAKPVVIGEDDVVFVFYNITWNTDKLTGGNRQDHENALQKDLDYASDNLQADAIFLSECGEIEQGLKMPDWTALLRRILPARCNSIVHQSHYTSIVDKQR